MMTLFNSSILTNSAFPCVWSFSREQRNEENHRRKIIGGKSWLAAHTASTGIQATKYWIPPCGMRYRPTMSSIERSFLRWHETHADTGASWPAAQDYFPALALRLVCAQYIPIHDNRKFVTKRIYMLGQGFTDTVHSTLEIFQ